MPSRPLVVKNGSKILSRCAAGMPLPLSAILISSRPGPAAASRSVATKISPPPAPMASAALTSRLISTCCSWLGSARRDGRSARSVRVTRMLFTLSWLSTISRARSTTWLSETSTLLAGTWREKSSSPRTISRQRLVSRTMVSRSLRSSDPGSARLSRKLP